jgi:aminoglycoside phosphotransferase (APT) family kinase protein
MRRIAVRSWLTGNPLRKLGQSCADLPDPLPDARVSATNQLNEADGSLFYVMPFVQGESLRDRLTRERQLPIEDAVRIAREVAKE